MSAERVRRNGLEWSETRDLYLARVASGRVRHAFLLLRSVDALSCMLSLQDNSRVANDIFLGPVQGEPAFEAFRLRVNQDNADRPDIFVPRDDGSITSCVGFNFRRANRDRSQVDFQGIQISAFPEGIMVIGDKATMISEPEIDRWASEQTGTNPFETALRYGITHPKSFSIPVDSINARALK